MNGRSASTSCRCSPVSRPTARGRGGAGLIVDHLADVLGESLGTRQAYLCGPPGMIDSCIGGLRAAGVQESATFFDKFLDQSHLSPAKKVA